MGRSLLLRLEAPSQAWDAHRFHATMSRRPLSRALDPAVLAPTRTAILLYDPKADRDSAVAAVERAEALADRWENAAAAFGISDSELDAAAFDLRRALGGAS